MAMVPPVAMNCTTGLVWADAAADATQITKIERTL
jgi:hypothetical protein